MLHSRRFVMFLFSVALAAALAAAGGEQYKLQAQSSPPPATGATPLNSDPSLIEVAPGIPLPPYGTAWILDSGENKSRLIRMRPENAVANKHIGKNLARDELMVLKDVSTLDLPGAASRLRITSQTTAIFIRKSELETQQVQPVGSAMGAAAHYVVLRLRQLEDRRVLCSFSYWKLGGKRARQEDDVENLTEEIAGGRWLKLTPKQPLPDGEYAIVAMPEDQTQASTSAYDFGVGSPLKPATHP